MWVTPICFDKRFDKTVVFFLFFIFLDEHKSPSNEYKQTRFFFTWISARTSQANNGEWQYSRKLRYDVLELTAFKYEKLMLTAMKTSSISLPTYIPANNRNCSKVFHYCNYRLITQNTRANNEAYEVEVTVRALKTAAAIIVIRMHNTLHPRDGIDKFYLKWK